MEGTGPTEGHQDKFPGIITALQGEDPQRSGHARIGDLNHPVRGIHLRELEETGKFLKGLLDLLRKEGHGPTQEIVRRDPSQPNMGVRECGQISSMTVTDWSRSGPGALRSHSEGSSPVDP